MDCMHKKLIVDGLHGLKMDCGWIASIKNGWSGWIEQIKNGLKMDRTLKDEN